MPESEVSIIPTIISIVISIISLLLSFIVLFRDWWHERLRINVYLVKWFASMVNGEPFFLWLIIQNDSSLPYSITKMELHGQRNKLELYAVSQGCKQLLGTVHKGDQKNEIYSKDYPITVNSYEGISGYFHFKSDAHSYNFEDQTFALTIYTNRGQKVIKNMHLSFGDNVMRAMQYREGAISVTHDANGKPITFTSEGL